MKHKTSELEGALLDAAVAKADGREFVIDGDKTWIAYDGRVSTSSMMAGPYAPSTSWGTGGPIIEREKIELYWHRPTDQWGASPAHGTVKRGYGPSPLIAAMRAYVAAKLGDEVDL